MANFCRFCGKELVNGQCDCADFQASMGNAQPQDASAQQAYQAQDYQNMYQDPYQGAYQNGYQDQNAYQNTSQKDPFIIPSFNLNFSSISAFVSSLRDLSGMSEPNSSNGDPYEHNVPIVPACIQPEENEIVVKQYNLARLRTRLKFMKAEGRLMVTNRRVLFRAAGTSLTGNILQEHQFNLDEIGGIEIHKDYKFSILSFLGCILLEILALYFTGMIFGDASSGVALALGVILGILGLVPTFIIYKHFWLKLFCAIVSSASFAIALAVADSGTGFFKFLLAIACIIMLINLIIVCFVPNLVVKIKTKGAIGAVVIGSQKAMFQRKVGDDYSGFAEVMPWEDTVMAMNEIGTMIDDLQKQGDYAIAKWSR